MVTLLTRQPAREVFFIIIYMKKNIKSNLPLISLWTGNLSMLGIVAVLIIGMAKTGKNPRELIVPHASISQLKV